MLYLLLGLTPPSSEAFAYLRQQQTLADVGIDITWHDDTSQVADKDAVDKPTLLIGATINTDEASPDEVVTALNNQLLSFRNDNDAKSDDGRGGSDTETTQCELWASAPCPLPLRPSGGYNLEPNLAGSGLTKNDERAEKSARIFKEWGVMPSGGYNLEPYLAGNDLTTNDAWAEKSARILKEWGVMTQQSILDAAQIAQLRTIVDETIENVEQLLAQHRPDITVGQDVFCYREIASRSRQRFDLRLQHPTTLDFVQQNVLDHPLVSTLLRESLGEPSELDCDVSVVYSKPGADHQGWHSDGDHQRGASDAGWTPKGWETRLASAYAICLFLPLIDLNEEVGYTQFWPGSNRHRDLVGFGKIAEVIDATFDGICRAGDAVWYDYRTLHRGMPNGSANTVRPVVQIIVKRRWYVEKQNYGLESVAG